MKLAYLPLITTSKNFCWGLRGRAASFIHIQGRIKAGADGAAAPGPPKNRPPLYQVHEVIKVTDTITFKK